MQRALATALLALIVVSLALPAQAVLSSPAASRDHLLSGDSSMVSDATLGSVGFSPVMDTSSSVPEYPLVSRALLLEGGSTDAVLEDFDGDGLDDLAVAVSDPNMLCVFFGQPDGIFLSWPNLNVSLDAPPIDIETVDRFRDGNVEIIALMSKGQPSDSDHFTLINITSKTSFTVEDPRTLNDRASNVVVGDFLGDTYYDLAIVSAGLDPETEDGIVEVFRGPGFTNRVQLYAGHGASSVACGDFDNSGSLDIAVGNTYDRTVDVFLSPLVPPVLGPNWTLSTTSQPRWLAAGDFNDDSSTDLVAACQESPSLEFFFQASNQLPLYPSYDDVVLSTVPSRVIAGDMNSDGRADLLVLSESACVSLGFFQEEGENWPIAPSFSTPTGAVPRGAVIGDLTGDGIVDVAIASARVDWSGSSIAILPGSNGFSNSNMTVWTAKSQEASLMATGDLDGDGEEDLILAYPSLNAFGYMRGFSGDVHLVNVSFNPENLLVADLDGDGLSDVVVANRTHGYVTIRFGTDTLPGGSMREELLGCLGNVTDVVMGDLNGDALIDVVAATSNGTIQVFFNTGSVPSFADSEVIDAAPWGNPILSVTVGDLDSDNLDDIAYVTPTGDIGILIQNDPGEPFSDSPDLTLKPTTGPVAQVWAGDVTGDWKDDIVALSGSGDMLVLFDQMSFSGVVQYETIDLPEVPHFVSVMDVTDDEHADLLVIFPSADLLFMYKQSESSLPHTPSMAFVTGAYPVCAGMGDATGDGTADLLVLDSVSDSVSVWVPVILDVGPVAMLSLSVPEPEEGVSFSFMDESVGYDLIVSWAWTLTYPDQSTRTWDLDGEAMSEVAFVLGDGDYSMRLDVREQDGDSDSYTLDFTVLEMPPAVTLTTTPPAIGYPEFETVTFVAEVESYDPVVSYEWDFDSEDGFVPDRETDEGETAYVYDEVGGYTAKVRVTDSDGSITVQSVEFVIMDAGLSGTFEADIVVTRDQDLTYVITFNASALAEAYPDITNTYWEFGDGSVTAVSGPPSEAVTHTYSPTRDYVVNLTVSDDDGNNLEMSRILHMAEPSIELVAPAEDAVVRSGTPIRLSIGDDSPPLVSVRYSVNGGEFSDFTTLYSICTEGWEDGHYVIEVMAEDKDGNIARKTILSFTIDDTPPVVTVLWDGSTALGGDKINVSVEIDDSNMAPGSVVLYVTFPGDDSESQMLMRTAGDGVYYTLVEVPRRKGAMEFHVYAQDLAGNSVTSETYTVHVELRFMDAAWPYLLLLAVLAALGTGAYFLRESRIAVDETFIIYKDGRMLAHSTRRLKPGMDDQVLSGMFIAIQDFIHDSFKDETSFRLRKLEFGEKSILVEKGDHLFMAVILHGKVSNKVAGRMRAVLRDIEKGYAEELTDWDGDLDKVRGVNDMVKKLYSKAPMLPEALRRKET